MTTRLDVPLQKRLLTALLWIGLYALIWGLGWWRPLDMWVNFVIVGAIVAAQLPQWPLRAFVGGAAEVAGGWVLFFAVNVRHPLPLILLGIGAAQCLFEGLGAARSEAHPHEREQFSDTLR